MVARLYKVCDDRYQATEFVREQKEVLRRRGLSRSWKVSQRPLTRTKDGYANPFGPWGVYLEQREDNDLSGIS